MALLSCWLELSNFNTISINCILYHIGCQVEANPGTNRAIYSRLSDDQSRILQHQNFDLGAKLYLLAHRHSVHI